MAPLPRRGRPRPQLHLLHPAGVHDPHSPRAPSGLHPHRRNRRPRPHRHRDDDPPPHGDPREALHPLRTLPGQAPRQRIPARHRPRRRVRSLRRAGPRGRLRRGDHGPHRPRDRRPGPLLRDRHGHPPSRLGPRGQGPHREDRGLPQPPETDPHHRGCRDDPPRHRSRHRPAREDPARPARLDLIPAGGHRQVPARFHLQGLLVHHLPRRGGRSRELRSAAEDRGRRRMVQHPPATSPSPRPSGRARSPSSTSGPTRASTASAPSPESKSSTKPTRTPACRLSACTLPSTPSRRRSTT